MKAYIYWSFIINSAWGLVAPVFAIFLIESITHGDVAEAAKVAGFGTFFYWTTKSLLQIPIAQYLDKNHGEIDDFWFFAIGTIITGLVPFGFLISSMAWHVYALNILHAIGMAMVVPSSFAIFIRHTDRGKEAYESGLSSTLLGFGVAITGAIGGILVAYIGFQLAFVLVGVMILMSVFVIFMVRDEMRIKMPQKIHEFPINKGPLVK